MKGVILSFPLGSGQGFSFRRMHGLIARFIEPMECLPVPKVPEGDQWTYELKLDGYRLGAVKTKGLVTL